MPCREAQVDNQQNLAGTAPYTCGHLSALVQRALDADAVGGGMTRVPAGDARHTTALGDPAVGDPNRADRAELVRCVEAEIRAAEATAPQRHAGEEAQ
jgi:hypothetical protein